MAKKNYYYTIIKTVINRTYGGSKVTANVYGVKRGEIFIIDTIYWNTRSFKGELSTVYTALYKHKLITKKEYKANGGYYSHHGSKVNIYEL